MKRIMKFESMSRCTCKDPVENFLKKRLEDIRGTPIHGVCESGFRYSGQPQMVETTLIGRKPAGDLTQRIFSCDLCIETSQELLPCTKILAISVAGQIFYGFFKTISGNELEKLLKDVIVVYSRISYAQLKTLDTFNITQSPTLTINPVNFYRTVVTLIRNSGRKNVKVGNSCSVLFRSGT